VNNFVAIAGRAHNLLHYTGTRYVQQLAYGRWTAERRWL